MENVPGMVQTNGGIGAKRVVEDFAKIGAQNGSYKLLYAPDYGIPQTRKRVFFVGLRDSHEDFKFPEPTVGKNDYVTCEEAIGDLPSLQTDEGDIIYGEEIQGYLYPIQNDYQKRMRANSEKVRNHIGSISNSEKLEIYDFFSSRREKITRHCQKNIREYINIMKLLQDIIARSLQIR